MRNEAVLRAEDVDSVVFWLVLVNAAHGTSSHEAVEVHLGDLLCCGTGTEFESRHEVLGDLRSSLSLEQQKFQCLKELSRFLREGKEVYTLLGP